MDTETKSQQENENQKEKVQDLLKERESVQPEATSVNPNVRRDKQIGNDITPRPIPPRED